MADKKSRIVIDDLRGGRNGHDAAWAIANNQCAEAINVEWFRSRIGVKRAGLTIVANSGIWGAADYFANLYRHVPTTDETLAELWAANQNAILGRMAGGSAFALPTMLDAPTAQATGTAVSFASFNGKLFIAYLSAVDRLHVWDGSTVRRVGIAAGGAPTVGNNGAGAYAAVLRYYRLRFTVQSGGVTIRRSEASASTSFTPSGAGASARVTQGTVPNEGETHWEIEASIDNVTFYRISTVVIATNIYDDTALVTTYNTNPLSAATGFYTVPTSFKLIAADQGRLIGFGSFTAANKQDDLQWTAVLGSSDIGDDERIDTTTNYRLGLDENDSGFATGLGGPVDGSFIATKEQQTWLLTPTGNVALPYRVEAISKSIGAVPQAQLARSEDEQGQSAVYWVSWFGPYRWSMRGGLQYLGRNVEDYPVFKSTIAKGTAGRVLAYTPKRQVYFWWASTLGNSGFPDVGFIYDIRTGGFSRFNDGDLIVAVSAATLFSSSLGASMSKDLKPYIAQSAAAGAGPRLYRGDESATSDDGVAFKAYVITKAYEPGGPGSYGEVGDAVLTAKATAGVTITATVTADFGLQSNTGIALLTASGAETRVTKRMEGSALAGDMIFVQHQLGDSAASTAAWALDRLVVPTAQRGPVGQ